MSKRVRPWDKKHRVQVPHPPSRRLLNTDNDITNNSSSRSTTNHNDRDQEVPHIMVNGICYYSDRFYLNRTCYDIDNTSVPSNSFTGFGGGGGNVNVCQCGAQCPPPLFDSGQLVASLDLKAAIFGTYTVDPTWLQEQFPSLFGPHAKIPTLVMHGQRGWTINQYQLDQVDTDDYVAESQAMEEAEEVQQEQNGLFATNAHLRHQQNNNPVNIHQQDELSVGTQNEATIKYADAIQIPPTPEKPKPPPATVAEPRQQRHSIMSFPSSVHFTECTTTWLAPQDMPPSLLANKFLQDDGTLQESIINNRRYKPGVHHPKFALLFESSGSLVVWVLTANLTRPISTDGTWIQRFLPKKTNNDDDDDDDDIITTTTDRSTDEDDVDNDFAHVLADLLFHETCAARPGQMTAFGFLRRYCTSLLMGGGGDDDATATTRIKIKRSFLNHHFDFTTAEVYLIPTVPGEYHDSSNNDDAKTNNKNNRQIQKYGRSKVQSLLEKLSHSKRPWLPNTILSPQDRLIFQPTSLGAQWCPKSLSNVVQSYMMMHGVEDPSRNNNIGSCAEESLLKQLDIIWPTSEFVAEVCKSLKGRHKYPKSVRTLESSLTTYPSSRASKDNQTSTATPNPGSVLATEQPNQGFLFLSSETFNSIHIDCLSRMVMFETSDPPQRPLTLIPHFKSVARLYNGGNHYRIRKEYGFAKSTEYFSWFIMTSACLSRGAQGHHHSHDDGIKSSGRNGSSSSNSGSGGGISTMSFSNFELGVLFCSRLQGIPRTDRLYCWKPSQCDECCPPPRRGPRLVHLPLPYSVRCPQYQQQGENDDDEDDDDHVDFCETPYFHEIPPGTGCIGNMRLTPYGEKLAIQQDELANVL